MLFQNKSRVIKKIMKEFPFQKYFFQLLFCQALTPSWKRKVSKYFVHICFVVNIRLTSPPLKQSNAQRTSCTMYTCYSGPRDSQDGTWRDSWTHLRPPLWRHPSGGRLLHLQVGRCLYFSYFLIARTGHERGQRR